MIDNNQDPLITKSETVLAPHTYTNPISAKEELVANPNFAIPNEYANQNKGIKGKNNGLIAVIIIAMVIICCCIVSVICSVTLIPAMFLTQGNLNTTPALNNKAGSFTAK